MADTPKTSIRIGDPKLRRDANSKIERLDRMGYRTADGKGISVSEALRLELARLGAEDDAATIKRLGLQLAGD